jgi:16S rRNA (cytosine967-C5)-methyltransferase
VNTDARRPGRPARGRRPQGNKGSQGSKASQGSKGPAPARRGDPARRTAYDVLAAVGKRDAYANLLLPRLLAERSVTGRDAALATELAYGTLRGRGTYDAVLAACSDRPLAKLDQPVLDVLRLGTHQLLATRVGSHAAVATSVDLAKAVAGPRVSGYVNAVLRRVAMRDAEQWLGLVAPARESDPDGYLAVRHSYPRWIVAAYRDALGSAAAGEIEAALAAGNDRPLVTMATLPGGPDRDAVMPDGATPGRWSPQAFTLPGGDPARLIESGAAAVQDEASPLAAIALASVPADGPDDAWLDMCAGPGGKARMLSGLAAAADARLVAADVHPHRAALVRAALEKAFIPHVPASPVPHPRPAAVVTTDGRVPAWLDGAFDRVLVDVPCSGLGALRRRPEARWRKSPDDLPALGELQRSLLRSAIAATRPGGVIAYVTCSPVPDETREVVTAVNSAADTPDAEILDAPAVLSGIPAHAGIPGPGGTSGQPGNPALDGIPGLRSPEPRFAQFWPHRHGTDAIFVALLRRV